MIANHGACEADAACPFIRQSAFLLVTTVFRRLRGGSQSNLVQCSDGGFYVLKMSDSQQGPNVLANEWLGNRISASLGILVPEVARLIVTDTLAAQDPQLYLERAGQCSARRLPGIHFGSRLAGELHGSRRPLDYAPAFITSRTSNKEDFIKMFVFDCWANTQDKREVVFVFDPAAKRSKAYFIDNGHMFGGPRWDGLWDATRIRFNARGSQSLLESEDLIDRFITKMERLVPNLLEDCIQELPRTWYNGDVHSLQSSYMRRLHNLRKLTSDAIASFSSLGVHEDSAVL